MELNSGVFTMMSSIVTVIGIIIATRYIYINKRYGKLISYYQGLAREAELKVVESVEESKANDMNIAFHDLLQFHSSIAKYKSKQDDNRTTGVMLDFIVLVAIIVLGTTTALEVIVFDFGIMNILLLTFLLTLFTLPMIHFLKHVKEVAKFMDD